MKRSVKESVQETVPFFQTAWLALNPWRYDEAGDRGMGSIFKYFFSFVFAVFVLAIILMLPAIASFVDNQMSHFDELKVTFETEMNSPVVFPENNPFVTLDTRKEEGTLKEGRFLITDDYLYTKQYFTGKVTQHDLGPYKNLLANEGIVIFLLLLTVPSLLFLFYVAYTIKVLLIVLLATIIAFVVARVVKFELPFLDAMKAGLLAATPMIIIDLVRLPFGFNVYYAQYIAFLVFFIVGVIKIGEFEGGGRRRSGKRRGYIDVGKRL
jgi:hypothetical protein